MRHLLHLLLLVSFSAFTSYGQKSFAEHEQYLDSISERVIMADHIGERRAAYDETVSGIVQALRQQGSYNYRFDKLKRISLLEPADSSFRIFSGQLYVDEDHYEYFGIIQKQSDPTNPIVLNDQSSEIFEIEQDILSKDDWYGAVYYNMKSFSKEGKLYYALFGFDTYEIFENRKVMEILHFNDGQPVFGAPVFQDDFGLTKNRLVVQYSSDVTVKLNYDEDLQLVVFDNLIPMKSPYKKSKIAMVPDGSYRGYQLNQHGNWFSIEKIFHTTLAEPPREKPVLDSEAGKDIFGKKKNRR